MALSQLWVLCTLTQGGYYEECSLKLGWKNKDRERPKVKWLKNQLKEKWNKKTKKTNKYKQEKKRVTYTNDERREKKVKEYEKLGEIKW